MLMYISVPPGRGSGARRQEARSGTMSTRNSNMNKLRHFWTLITVLLVAGVMSSASAFAQHLHDQLLRPESEHVGTDAARLAERRRRNLLPDTLGRAARRDRLGQRRTGHDLQRQRGLFPNCGDPSNLSQPFPLHYWDTKIAIGVAWPNPKDYRYQMQSVPIVDGSDGSCAQYSNRPGQVTNWWVHELKEPKRGTYVFTAAVSFQQGEKG